MPQERQVAYKVWISDLHNGKYVKEDGEWDPNYLLVRDKKISRVNIIATVVDKLIHDGAQYGTVELDDGSGKISVKAWREDVSIFSKVKLGDLVLFLGRVKEFNNEIYLTPEIVNSLDNLAWAKIRKLELLKIYGEPTVNTALDKDIANSQQIERPAEQTASESSRQKILRIVASKDGVWYDELINESGLNEIEVKGIILELVKEGEVYQPRAGVIKAI